MNWIIYALVAIGLMGFSDFFRKLASGQNDPVFSNLVFQSAAYLTGLILFFLYNRKVEISSFHLVYAIIGGTAISLFTTLSFKALSVGPGVSVVMPVLRIGGVTLVAILGTIILKEKISVQTVTGLLLSFLGIYLLFSNK